MMHLVQDERELPQDERDLSQDEREQRAAIASANGARECDLRRNFNLSRAVARRIITANPAKARIKDDSGEPKPPLPVPLALPPPLPEQKPQLEPKQPLEPVTARVGRWFHKLVLIGAATALGAGGIFINVQVGMAFGHTPATSIVFGVIGGGVDVLTIFLPSNLFVLIRQWRYAQLVLTLLLWAPFAVISGFAGWSFSAINIGDHIQERDGAADDRATLTRMIKSLEHDRAQIKEARSPAAIEHEIQIAAGDVPPANRLLSSECNKVTISGPQCRLLNQLRAAKEDAIKRDALDAEIKANSAKRAVLPIYASADPSAEQFSEMIGGRVSVRTIQNIRTAGYAFLPHAAGLVLALARAL